MSPPPALPQPTRLERAAAGAAMLCYLGHAGGYYARVGQPEGALWACHVGTALIAAGLALRSPRANAVGVAWLSFGTPVWLADIAMGAGLIPTSLLTHVVGYGIGLWAAARLGFPSRTWWRALVGIVALQQFTRLVAPPATNVNVAFHVHPSMAGHFSSYAAYWLFMTAVLLVVLVATELLVRAVLRRIGRA